MELAQHQPSAGRIVQLSLTSRGRQFGRLGRGRGGEVTQIKPKHIIITCVDSAQGFDHCVNLIEVDPKV
jgi:hypothetical protein